MGPAFALGALLVLSLVALGVTLRASPRSPRRADLSMRRAVPWIAIVVAVVGLVLLAIPRVPPLVVVGLMVYAAVAAAAMWRMASLDRGSRWMAPSSRTARLGISAIALTWLGIVLGLLLRIADLLANAA